MTIIYRTPRTKNSMVNSSRRKTENMLNTHGCSICRQPLSIDGGDGDFWNPKIFSQDPQWTRRWQEYQLYTRWPTNFSIGPQPSELDISFSEPTLWASFFRASESLWFIQGRQITDSSPRGQYAGMMTSRRRIILLESGKSNALDIFSRPP